MQRGRRRVKGLFGSGEKIKHDGNQTQYLARLNYFKHAFVAGASPRTPLQSACGWELDLGRTRKGKIKKNLLSNLSIPSSQPISPG